MTATMEEVMPLQSGDRLARAEFHQRYCANPKIKRAELVLGVVYVASPMRFDRHDEQTARTVGWLYTYQMDKPRIRLGNTATIYLLEDTEVQPDAFLFYEPPTWPGGIRHTEDGYLEGAPDLVIEIAASSASYDLHDKMEACRGAGVPEYIVWRVLDKAIDWFRLRNGVYVRLEPDEQGIITSEVFPGLRLDVAKMLAGDDRGVVDALNEAE